MLERGGRGEDGEGRCYGEKGEAAGLLKMRQCCYCIDLPAKRPE